MDKLAAGLLLIAGGALLVSWYARQARSQREAMFRNLSEGRL